MANEEGACVRDLFARWDRLTPASLIQAFIDEIRSDGPFVYPENILIDQTASVETLGVISQTEPGPAHKELSLEISDDPVEIERRLTQISQELPLLEKQCDGAKILHDLYSKQPELADQKTRKLAAQKLNDLTEQLQHISLERDRLRVSRSQSQLDLDLDDDHCDIEEEPHSPHHSKSSSILWENNDGGQQPTSPKSPGINQITESQEGVLRKHFAAKALYDFSPQDAQRELAMKEGDLVTILCNEGEWWQARDSEGRIGYVPFNYVSSSE